MGDCATKVGREEEEWAAGGGEPDERVCGAWSDKGMLAGLPDSLSLSSSPSVSGISGSGGRGGLGGSDVRNWVSEFSVSCNKISGSTPSSLI